MIEHRIAGAIKTTAAWEVVVGGQAREVVLAEAQTSGGPKVFYRRASNETMTVTTSSEPLDLGSQYVTGEHITATPSGGTAPYTYAWTWVYNGSGSLAVYEETTASPRFIQNGSDSSDPLSTYEVTVTDATGLTATANGTLTPGGGI